MAQARIQSDISESPADTAEQIQQIAARLWDIMSERPDLSGRPAPASPERPVPTPQHVARNPLAAVVEDEYLARRSRDSAFGHELFGEPAWDMLLYLYAAHLRGDFVTTSSLARASAVPPTTALRWMAQLEQARLVERSALKRDGRVRVLKLTRRALKLLEQHFNSRMAHSWRDRSAYFNPADLIPDLNVDAELGASLAPDLKGSGLELTGAEAPLSPHTAGAAAGWPLLPGGDEPA